MKAYYTKKAYTPFGQYRALLHLMMKLELLSAFEYKHFLRAKFPSDAYILRYAGRPKPKL